MDKKDNDASDVSAEFLHNVQTAVDSTGVGGRVGVINTEQGPLTVIFMDENEGGASAVSSAGDTTIQYVVDNSDTSTMQYITDTDGTTIQYVTEDTVDTATDSSNVQYFQDESGQIIQYVNDTTTLAEQPTSTSGTVQDGATEVITYLVDESGNIIQYVSGDASAESQLVASDANSTDDAQLVTGGVTSDSQFVASSASTDTQLVASDTSADTPLVSGVADTHTQFVADNASTDTHFVPGTDTTLATSSPSTETQYVAVDPSVSTDTPRTVQLPDDGDTFTATPYNPNQTPGAVASAPTQKTNLDSLVQPIINLQNSTVQPGIKQVGPQVITLTQQSDRGGKSLIYKPQPSYKAPQRQAATSLLKPQPGISATMNHTTSTRLTSGVSKAPTALLTNKPPVMAGYQSSAQASSILTMKKPNSMVQSNIVTITPSVSKIMPVATGSQPGISSFQTQAQSAMPKIQIITSPTKPKVTTLGPAPLVEKSVSHLMKTSSDQITTGVTVTTVSPTSYTTSTKQMNPSVSKSEIIIPMFPKQSGVEALLTQPVSQKTNVSIVVQEPAAATVGIADPVIGSTGTIEPAVATTSTEMAEQPPVDNTELVEPEPAATTTEAVATGVDLVTSSTTGSPLAPAEPSDGGVSGARTGGDTAADQDLTQDTAAGEAPLVSSTSTNDGQAARDDLTEAEKVANSSEIINGESMQYDDVTVEPIDGKDGVNDEDTAFPPDGLEAYAPISGAPFQCKECNQEFSTEKLLRRHLFSSYVDNENKFFCTICKEDLKSKFRIRRHVVDKHTVGMPYKCPHCPASYNTTSAYWTHAQIHAKLLTCEFCGKAFAHKHDLKRHIFSMHDEDKEYICPFCGDVLADKHAYRKHREEKHGYTGELKKNRAKLIKGPRTTKIKVTAREHGNDELTTETTEAANLLVESAENSSPSETTDKVVLAQQSQHIQLPPGMGDKGEVTIQLFGDGTMMTTDGSNVDYGTVDLSSLGIDPDMLQDNTDIELIIVQGDGDQIKEQLENDPSKLTNVLKDNPTQTVTVKNTPVKQKAGKGAKYSKYISTGTGPRPYRCKQCPRTFRYYRHLRCHEVAHTSNTSIVCPLCQRCFVREANLTAHLELHKNKSMLPEIFVDDKPQKTAKDFAKNEKGECICELCKKVFATSARLKRHMDQVHLNIGSLPCPICSRVMKNEDIMQRHLRQHVGPFTCYDCDTKFTLRNEYLDHQMNAHPRRSYACRICSKQFTSKMHLWNHMRKAHMSPDEPELKLHKEYACDECSKIYSRPDKLKAHMSSHTGIREHKCSHCDMCFVVAWKLKQHVNRVHIDNTKCPCTDCERSFSTSKKLEIHNNIWHSGPYPCNVCSESFAHKQELVEHEFDAHSLNGIECPVCSMKLKNKSDLAKHHEDVHDAYDHLCDLCGESFPHKTKLKGHLTDEHFDGEGDKMLISYPDLSDDIKVTTRKFACEFCEKSFSYKIPFKAHLKSVHFDGDETVLIENYPDLLRVPDPPEPAICDYCGKTFAKQSSLNFHLKVHGVNVKKRNIKEELIPSSDEDPDLSNIEPREKQSEYSCDICGREFSRHASLKKHVAVHLEMNETDVAMKKVELEEHERAEEEEQMERDGRLVIKGAVKEYLCLDCKHVFKRKADLENHMLEHNTGKKKTKSAVDEVMKSSSLDCNICGKYFSEHINLRRHTLLKHGIKLEKPDKSMDTSIDQVTAIKAKAIGDSKVTCRICEKVFASGHGMRRHIRNVHKVLDSKSQNQFLGKNFSLQAKTETKQSDTEDIKSKNVRKLKKSSHDESKEPVEGAKDDSNILDGGKIVFPCNMCGNIYASSWGLMQHIHDKHPGSEDDANVQIDDIFGKVEKEVSPANGDAKQISKASRSSSKLKRASSKSISSNEVKSEASEDQQYSCPYCSNHYASAKGRIKHIQIMHPGKKINYSSNVTPSRPSMTLPAPKPKPTAISRSGRIITKKVFDDVALQCYLCEKFFTEDMYLNRHMKMTHGIKGEPSSKKRIFKQSENGEFDTYSCEKCSKSFSALRNLRLHMIMKHKVKVSYEALLSQTESKHSSEKQIHEKKDAGCNICEMNFRSVTSLQQHIAMKHKNDERSDEPPKKKMKPTLQSPIKQEKEEAQENLYKCEKCSNQYSKLVNLRRHMIMKHKMKISSEALQAHGESKVKCQMCGKSFGNTRSLQQHISMKHKADDQPDEPPRKKMKLIHKTNDLQKQGEGDGDLEKEIDQKNGIQCNMCEKYFRNIKLLHHHISMKHEHDDPLSKPLKKRKMPTLSPMEKTDQDKNIVKSMSHTCKECQKSLHGWKALKRHMQLKHGLKFKNEDDVASVHTRSGKKNVDIKQEVLECDVCQNKFISQKTLDVHMRKHTGETPYSCSLCEQKFISKFKLECHYKSVHAKKYNKMVKCKTCLSLFNNENSLLKHKITHKKADTFECRFCKTKFTDNDKHAEHEKVHTDRPYRCEQCDKSFRWRRNLASHIGLFHNGSETLTCSVCSKVFSSQENLDKHVVIHKVNKHLCKKCGKKFENQKMLQSHIDIAHTVKKAAVKLSISKATSVKQMKNKSAAKSIEKQLLLCNICNKSFNLKEKLVEHMLSHTSVKQPDTSVKKFKCDRCPLSYSCKRSLITHEKKHKRQEKIRQNQKSIKKTTAKTACPTCGKSFDTKVNMSRHILAVHKKKESRNKTTTKTSKVNVHTLNEKNYCKKCKLTFSKRFSYKRHMTTVHGYDIETSKCPKAEIPNICPVCSTTFKSVNAVERHVMNVHKCKLGGLPTVEEIQASEYSANFRCYYCSDCTKVHWSQNSYMTHLKEMHPDRIASDLDNQALTPMPMTGIKREMEIKKEMEIKNEIIDSKSPDHSRQQKRAQNVGPVRHKCDFCGRVHWTEKSFEAHMLKFHPGKEAKNPLVGSDSPYINTYPSIEMVNDGDHEHFEYEDIAHNAPANYKQLSGAPIVRLERIPKTFAEDCYPADDTTHTGDNENVKDVDGKQNPELGGNDSVTHEDMEVGDSHNIADSEMSNVHVEIEQGLQNTDNEGIDVHNKNVEYSYADSPNFLAQSVDEDFTSTSVNDKTLDVHKHLMEGIEKTRTTSENLEHTDCNREIGEETIESHSEKIDNKANAMQSTSLQDVHGESLCDSHGVANVTRETDLVTLTSVAQVETVDEVKNDNDSHTESCVDEKGMVPDENTDSFVNIDNTVEDDGLKDSTATFNDGVDEESCVALISGTASLANETPAVHTGITELMAPVHSVTNDSSISEIEQEQKDMTELCAGEPAVLHSENVSSTYDDIVERDSESFKDSTGAAIKPTTEETNIMNTAVDYEHISDLQSVVGQTVKTDTENMGHVAQVHKVNELNQTDQQQTELYSREEDVLLDNEAGVSDALEEFVETATGTLGISEDGHLTDIAGDQNIVVPSENYEVNKVDGNTDSTDIEKYSHLEDISSGMCNITDVQTDSSEFAECVVQTEIPVHSSENSGSVELHNSPEYPENEIAVGIMQNVDQSTDFHSVVTSMPENETVSEVALGES